LLALVFSDFDLLLVVPLVLFFFPLGKSLLGRESKGAIDGSAVGFFMGDIVYDVTGATVACFDGSFLESVEGCMVGAAVGAVVGDFDATLDCFDGATVGAFFSH